MPVAARAGFEADAEQREEREALPLRDQVGAVEQRVAEPGEQLDQRAARIAEPGIRPLRGVRRDARDQVFDEVVEAAVIQARWKNGHARFLSLRAAR